MNILFRMVIKEGSSVDQIKRLVTDRVEGSELVSSLPLSSVLDPDPFQFRLQDLDLA